MRWRGRRESSNVEDRRGESTGAGFPFPFPGRRGRRIRFPMPRSRRARRGGGIGLFGILIVFGAMLFLGIDPRVLLQGGSPGAGPQQPGRLPRIEMPDLPNIDARSNSSKRTRLPGSGTRPRTSGSAGSDPVKSFVSVVFADTEDVWNALFKQFGRPYSEPKLVLFDHAIRSGCGQGLSAMGPFYCPLDRKVYIDLSFFRELKEKFKAPGDFAQAYVLAHEVGHHVQTLLGISNKVQRAKAQVGKRDANRLQVMMELQADCLAGLWAKHADKAKNILEQGDIDEALRAATAIGDDRIQRRTTGFVVPDSFTHGSSKQRVRWFKTGFKAGSLKACDTFNAPEL